MKWYIKVVRENYFNFTGRAGRKEYWMFYLFHILFILAAIFIDVVENLDGVITICYVLGTIIPGLAVVVRRLHDIGKSAWFLLVQFIPYIGTIVLLIFMATEGDSKNNEYGPPVN